MDQGYTQEDLRRFLAQIKPSVKAMVEAGTAITSHSRPMPREIYHYTNTEALMGIVENEELWATDSRFLNDTAETQWASRLFISAIDDIKPSNAAEVEMLSRLKSSVVDGISGYAVYIASFSEEKDDLPQWRGYGSSNSAVSIGFRSNRLSARFGGYELLSVIYDEHEQKRIAKDLVNIVYNFYKSNAAIDNPATSHFLIPECLQSFRLMAIYSVLRFKQPRWHSEKEWRLVAFEREWDAVKSLSFRSGVAGLTPFIKMKGEEKSVPFELMIEEVMIGPSPHQERSKMALELYLNSKMRWTRQLVTMSDLTLR
ncbi:DUF2971 domain-containing protein [Sphingomonas sp. 22R3R2A-7]|uniref:DUF2971 domain-containing protein n=1 Tax=Sphingomonas sp. 22R3R2A-7 TaxID=3050230 RepID=UPI002FDFD1AD